MISARQNISRRCMCVIGYVMNENSSYLNRKKTVFSRNFYHNCFKETDRICKSSYRPNSIQSRKPSWIDLKCSFTLSSSKSFSTEYVPKDSDMFGHIGFGKSVRYKMDEEEEKEEKFTENEARVPRRFKLSVGQYAKKIKSYINKGDLDSALNVLDLVKENRDKPTTYMYTLLIRAFAIQGDLNQCISLYNAMKERSLKPSAATFTSLFNACATSKNSEKAIFYLNKLRQYLYENAFPLNAPHYHVMMKAYSLHNCIPQAFELVDEMRDKGMYIGQHTYNSLLYSAICDKKAGLRHALILWHTMRAQKIKMNTITYNLLLRAIRDTEFGVLKVNDVLLKAEDTAEIKICIADKDVPNLLATPPIVNNLLPTVIQDDVRNTKAIVAKDSNVELMNLNDILTKNRLILFGGYKGILQSMDNDSVVPDSKTISLLTELVPPNVKSEEELIECAKSRKIELDVHFYNILMKRRCTRFDYKEAQEVLYLMQKDNIRPNVTTFGILALGCINLENAMELLEGMENTGYVPNDVIMTTLISNGCHYLDIKYILEMLKYMRFNKIRPCTRLFECLDKFEERASFLIKEKGTLVVNKNGDRKYIKKAAFKDDFAQFKERYHNWKEFLEQKGWKILT